MTSSRCWVLQRRAPKSLITVGLRMKLSPLTNPTVKMVILSGKTLKYKETYLTTYKIVNDDKFKWNIKITPSCTNNYRCNRLSLPTQKQSCPEVGTESLNLAYLNASQYPGARGAAGGTLEVPATYWWYLMVWYLLVFWWEPTLIQVLYWVLSTSHKIVSWGLQDIKYQSPTFSKFCYKMR